MLFVILGIKCRGAQRRVVAFHLQSPNEEESISLTSANTLRHADKHWIFIIHFCSLSLTHTHLTLSIQRKSTCVYIQFTLTLVALHMSKKKHINSNIHAHTYSLFLHYKHTQSTHTQIFQQNMMQVCWNSRGLQQKIDVCCFCTQTFKTNMFYDVLACALMKPQNHVTWFPT